MPESRSAFWPHPPVPARPKIAASPAAGSNGRSDTDIPAAFWALVGFTTILLVAPQSYWSPLAAVPLAKVSVIGAVLTYISSSVSRGRPVIRWGPEFRIATILLTWAVVTIPLAIWPGGAFAA